MPVASRPRVFPKPTGSATARAARQAEPTTTTADPVWPALASPSSPNLQAKPAIILWRPGNIGSACLVFRAGGRLRHDERTIDASEFTDVASPAPPDQRADYARLCHLASDCALVLADFGRRRTVRSDRLDVALAYIGRHRNPGRRLCRALQQRSVVDLYSPLVAHHR